MEYLLQHLWDTVWKFLEYYLEVGVLADKILSGLIDTIRPVIGFLFGLIDILTEVARDLVQFITTVVG